MFGVHKKLERNSIAFVLGVIVVASIGGFVEIAPLFTIDETVEADPDMRLYTPLETAGRNIYIREGCYACHSQMIRTLRDDVERYGHYSLAVESKYDHPMLWGSKRTGPDLARVGGKYSDEWQAQHLRAPRSLVPASKMPNYAFLDRIQVQPDKMASHLRALRTVGVPYTDEMIENASADTIGQADPDGDLSDGVYDRYGAETNVRNFDGDMRKLTEMDALVAYLQILGQLTDLPDAPGVEPSSDTPSEEDNS